jgi:DNA-binding MarR family transcriptional regulator
MGELTERELSMWNRFHAMRRQLDRYLERSLQSESDVSAAEFEVLRALALAEGHQLRVTELAEVVNWEQSRVSHQIARMLPRGSVERRPDPTDGRAALIVLTPAGLAAGLEAMPDRADRLHAVFFDLFDDAELDAIHEMSARILAAIEKADDERGSDEDPA